MENQQNQNSTDPYSSNELESLESTAVPAEQSPGSPEAPAPAAPTPEPKKPKGEHRLKRLFRKFNIYLLLFVLVLAIAIIVTVVSYIRSKQADENRQQQLATEPLSQEELSQLRQSDVKIGGPRQVLNVEANAVFTGKVLVRDSLEVAGEIRTGSAISAPGLNVSGTSILNQVQAGNVQVSGNATIQGQISSQGNLSVAGSGSFGGTLTAARLNIQDLLINGNLQVARHIDAGGPTPTHSGGSALGNGGTSSVSGTDTAGTVNINIGGGPGAGCFVTVNFAQRFNGSPHVTITPVGAAAANLRYYINRSNNNFSICSTNAAPAGQSFAFDYIVID
jgi:cytoskeletal protein CcmA (bactofilin family)